MKQFNQLREETLEEKLKASDPAGTYIHDFVHSDNPKFAGKSKKKRIQMALAASYAAKGKSRNEEVEEVDEGVMDTVKTVAKKVGKALTGGSDEDQLKNLQKKMGVPQTGKKPTSEEVEQIDELKKTTLGSYVKKASVNMANQASKLETTPMGQSDKAAGHARKIQNRQFGIKDAVARLTKEDSTYGARADKLLARSHQAHREGQKDVGSRAHALFLKARDKHWSDPVNKANAIKKTMSGANDYYKSKKPGEYTGD
jgi:hypothetical protein